MSTQTTQTVKTATAPATDTRVPGNPVAGPVGPTATAPTTTDAPKKELSTAFISDGGFVLTAELSATTAPVRARSERQQEMDKVVRQLHTKWVTVGRPSTWDAMVKAGAVATYFVDPELSANFHGLINKAVTFVKIGDDKSGIRSRMGSSFKVNEAHIAKFKLPAEYLGREAISFAIMDKRPRAASDKPATGKPATDKTAPQK